MKTDKKMNPEEEGCCGGGCHSQEAVSEEKETICSPTAQELTDLLQRTHANFENYRKQMQAHIEDIRKMAAKEVILQLLPIVDNFALALKSVPAHERKKDFVHGMELIHSQLMQLLQNNNVTTMETTGKDFDPYYHEALMKVPSEVPANKIMEEFQKGFLMQGKVLRHAKVKISAGNGSNDAHVVSKQAKEKNTIQTEE